MVACTGPPDVAASITGKVSKKAYTRFTTSRKKLTGAISGSAILKKRRIGPAPSMAAASINERGMDCSAA
ncbi:hypothetical protein D3C76_1821360 [compost metagenome]